MTPRRVLPPILAAALSLLGACGQSAAAPADLNTVLSVIPAANASGVDPTSPVVIQFSHPMRTGMEQYAAIHVGDVSGPVVSGTWTWSDDHMQLTFTPDAPLEPGTRYAVHLGGGMQDADGDTLDYQYCAQRLGGQWVTQSMMGGSMMGGGMMGTGWQGADGTYGMVFFFTTA